MEEKHFARASNRTVFPGFRERFIAGVIGFCLAFGFSTTCDLRADSFGTFNIDFVTVGNPGNPDDTGTTGVTHTVAGAVNYSYRIGKLEVSRAMITSVASILSITMADMSGYDSGDTPNSPATGVSWNEAARFVNWLNTSTGHSPAYKFAIQPGEGGYDPQANIELWEAGDAGYDPANPFRNKNAYYFLPSDDEWYKAAYYSGTGAIYYDYATGSDIEPDIVDFDGDTDFEDWLDGGENPFGPTEVNNIVTAKPSHYGTYFQGGNVSEWCESSSYNQPNDDPAHLRSGRGGHWSIPNFSRSSTRNSQEPTYEYSTLGFRVGSKAPADPNAVLKASLQKKAKKLKKALKRAQKSSNTRKASKLKAKLKKLIRRIRSL